VTPTPDATTPTFSWMAPSPEPAGGYGYYISVDGPSVSWWYPGVGRMPSTQTSVLYDVDQGSTSPSLTPGTTYGWSIVVEDASWNTCAVETTYTP
jgi:hypothetical protein